MAANFPTSLDTDSTVGGGTNPATTDTTDSPSHAELHQTAGEAVVAVETKVGTGSSTPTNGAVLIGDGSGTSTWDTSPTIAGAVTLSSTLSVAGAVSGAGFEWAAHSPAWTSFTIGNGSATVRYVQVGDIVHYSGIVTLGSTSSVSSTWKVDLPVNANSQSPGSLFMYDSSAGDYWSGSCVNESATTLIFVTTKGVGAGLVTTGQPFTWAASDQLMWHISYEAA